MARLRAFRAVRPSAQMAAAVAALPYDVVSRAHAREIGGKNPYSFLHVDRAEMDLDPDIDLYAPEVYEKARQNLDQMERDGILKQDEKPCFYIYEQEREGHIQTGIAGCASIDDYLNGVVRKHELTREDKELDRIRHVDVCDANTGPIFLAAKFPQDLKEHIARWKREHPCACDFTAEDGIGHRVWVIDDEDEILRLSGCFDDIPFFYIADGHHRAASAVKVGLKRRSQKPDYSGEEEFNFFLSVVFPYDELTILGYHRIVKDLGGHSPEEFLRLSGRVLRLVRQNQQVIPGRRHSLGVYVDGSWYYGEFIPELLEDESIRTDVVQQLDVSLLQNHILLPVLGIEDPRTDERIRFIGGNHHLDRLAREVDETGGVAFAMYPTSMEELMAIADAGRLMPPKSTWFEPKLRSGLLIHRLQ